MGYTTKGSITSFWPDDTADVMYILSGLDLSLSSIIDVAKAKWPGKLDYEDIRITAEYIHTDCITFDGYDAGDYANFIVITRVVK